MALRERGPQPIKEPAWERLAWGTSRSYKYFYGGHQQAAGVAFATFLGLPIPPSGKRLFINAHSVQSCCLGLPFYTGQLC